MAQTYIWYKRYKMLKASVDNSASITTKTEILSHVNGAFFMMREGSRGFLIPYLYPSIHIKPRRRKSCRRSPNQRPNYQQTFHITSPVKLFRSEEHTSELQSRFDLVC